MSEKEQSCNVCDVFTASRAVKRGVTDEPDSGLNKLKGGLSTVVIAELDTLR